MSAPTGLRRQDLEFDQAGIERLLDEGFCGRLATVGADGQPYCSTMLFLAMDGAIFLHGTRDVGHLRRNVEHEPRVCFTVDRPGEVFDYGRFACDSSVSYESVVAFGRITVVDDAPTKQRFFERLMVKYRKSGPPRPENFFPRLGLIVLYRLDIERVTGKQIVLPGIDQQWPSVDRTKTPNAKPPG
jgi:nitroimidazol reductase NimA-like FMN-containing flavoprotein (pyridoxamine 5'-phosphate oxidase superfamily)